MTGTLKSTLSKIGDHPASGVVAVSRGSANFNSRPLQVGYVQTPRKLSLRGQALLV